MDDYRKKFEDALTNLITEDFLDNLTLEQKKDIYEYRLSLPHKTYVLVNESYNSNWKNIFNRHLNFDGNSDILKAPYVDNFKEAIRFECYDKEDFKKIIESCLDVIYEDSLNEDISIPCFVETVLPYKTQSYTFINNLFTEEVNLTKHDEGLGNEGLKETVNNFMSFDPDVAAVSLYNFCDAFGLFELYDKSIIDRIIETFTHYRLQKFGINDSTRFERIFLDLFKKELDPVDVKFSISNDILYGCKEMEKKLTDYSDFEIVTDDFSLKDKILHIIPLKILQQKIILFSQSKGIVNYLTPDWKGYIINQPDLSLILTVKVPEFDGNYICYDKIKNNLYYIYSSSPDKLYLLGMFHLSLEDNSYQVIDEKIEITKSEKETGNFVFKS